MFDLISIGSITNDLFVLTDRGKIFKTPKDPLALEWIGFELGEKIFAEEILESAGGVATNLSVGTNKLGLKAAFIGPNQAATSVIILDKKSGERVIFLKKSSGEINLGPLKNMKTAWLSVSSLAGNWNAEAKEILAYIRRENAKLILAPSTSMIREGYRNLKKLLKDSDILFLNRNEATEIAFHEKIKTREVNRLMTLLHQLGPQVVCLTDGRKGAYCSNRKKIYFSPIKKVKTVDVTGAGDAFASGFLGLYLRGVSIEKSLRMGIRNSANVVRYIGTTKGLLSK